MQSLSIAKVLLRERMASEPGSVRKPEPDLVMDDADKVAAYTRAGRIDGVMSPVYLFHALNICEVIEPGMHVLDLACGPATQLAQVAALNRESRFTGVDLSEPMLDRAREHVAALRLANVDFAVGSITDLSRFESQSVDAVVSTMALHHLPDVGALAVTLAEVARVLKPDGGLYLVDFGRLRTPEAIGHFVDQYRDRQPELFTLDYQYSLQAAFSFAEFREAAAPLLSRARLYRTCGFEFMVALKSRPCRALPPGVRRALRMQRDALPRHHRQDFAQLKLVFRLGGLRTARL